MELPQSRPFGTAQAATKGTHDFLSLYSHSSVQQDPRPSHGGLLKTHNFLQPLEGKEKNAPKEDDSVDINVEKPAQATPTVGEHLLPGGIGTYSISHISCLNPRVPKPEDNAFTVASVTSNDNNSNCSSYTGGSGFALWDEQAASKASMMKEKLKDISVLKESAVKMGQWALDRPSQSSSNHCGSVSPLSSQAAAIQKSQSFMDMINSAKGPHSMDDTDEGELIPKKESSPSQKGELRVKVDGKSSDQKANTPRSKHSATEQRRRCKINDRFQMLRELIPHSDQKRDKASFLLEVIEYIQFLQEKVNRYEGPYPGWNSEPAKLTPWRNCHGPAENLVDQSQVVNALSSSVLMFGATPDEKPTAIPLKSQRNSQIPAEPSVATAANFMTADQQFGITNKAIPISPLLHQETCAPIRNTSAVPQPIPRLLSEGHNAPHAQLQSGQNKTAASEPASTSDKLKDQNLALEGGTINISSIYSQGLLKTLTQALQTSGVDLSQASISVQVDIGKRAANHRQNTQEPIEKVAEVPTSSQSFLRSRVESSGTESNHHGVKRIKTG